MMLHDPARRFAILGIVIFCTLTGGASYHRGEGAEHWHALHFDWAYSLFRVSPALAHVHKRYSLRVSTVMHSTVTISATSISGNRSIAMSTTICLQREGAGKRHSP